MRLISLASVLMLLYVASVGAQQVSKYDALEAYLNQKMMGHDPVRIIKAHLIESGTSAPLDELVAWTKAGFPDLQENGYWKTEALSLRLAVATSLHYYFSTAPPPDKSTRYLEVIDELQGDDYISYHLVGMAHLIIDEAVLEARVLKLLEDKNPKMRSQGVWMGRTLAETKPYMLERYHQMLKNDADAHVRTTILSSMLSWPKRRDVAFFAFERLLNDTNENVRKLGARGLEIAAERGVITGDDLATILRPMLKTNDPFVRASIGNVAAELTTDKSRFVLSHTLTDEMFAGFIRNVKAKESTAGSSLSEAELAKLWLEWWAPLVPKYTTRIRLVH